jgi:hypothetical protein
MLALNRLEQKVNLSQGDEIVCHVGVFKEGYYLFVFSLPQLLSVQLTTSISNRDMYVLLESHLFENMDLMNNILYSRHFQVESQPSGRSTVVVCCELFSPLLSGFILKSPKNNIPKEAAER